MLGEVEEMKEWRTAGTRAWQGIRRKGRSREDGKFYSARYSKRRGELVKTEEPC